MAGWLDALLDLQDVDLKIRSLKKRLEMIPKERNELKDQRTSEKDQLNVAKADIVDTEGKLKGFEALMKKHYDAIAKLQQRSTQIRRNDEYQANLREIDFNKAKISDIETETIVLMDKLDNMKRNFISKEEECAARVADIENEIDSMNALEEEVRDVLKELAVLRAERAAKVSSQILDDYERILGKNVDTPAVKIINGNICANCRLKITPQTINNAKSGSLTHCDNCSHIVYFRED